MSQSVRGRNWPKKVNYLITSSLKFRQEHPEIHSLSLNLLTDDVYLEPIDGAAVDEGREFAEPVSEGVSDGTHGKNDVELVAAPLDEVVEESDRRLVSLLRLVSLPAGGAQGRYYKHSRSEKVTRGAEGRYYKHTRSEEVTRGAEGRYYKHTRSEEVTRGRRGALL